MFIHILGLAALQVLATLVDVCSSKNASVVVNLRIEGSNHTIFEGPIKTSGHNITTASGGTHHCDGTNNGENIFSGPTATSALDDASHKKRFTFDGTFSPEFDDFLITRIGGDLQSQEEFWMLLVNFTFTQVGGCQQAVTKADDVLWAFGTFSDTFLKLTGPATVQKGYPIAVTVTDGATGSPVPGASIGGQTTGTDGTATLTFTDIGLQRLKAENQHSIRSNALVIDVTS